MSEWKSSKGEPWSAVSLSSAVDLLHHVGQGCRDCCLIMVYGMISFVFKEEPRHVPLLRLQVVYDLGRKGKLGFRSDFCLCPNQCCG